jgi:hypothetical protein
VKVSGPIGAGEHVVPSGAEDGTAVRAPCSDPPVRLGRAQETADVDVISSRGCCGGCRWISWLVRHATRPRGSSGPTDSLLEMHELSKSTAKSGPVKPWQLVKVSVTSPADSVSGRGRGHCGGYCQRYQRRVVALAAMMAVLLCMKVIMTLGERVAVISCPPVTITNGSIEGDCDGKRVGGTCHYTGCDEGFFLAGAGGLTRNDSTEADSFEGFRVHPVCRHCNSTIGMFCELATGECESTRKLKTSPDMCTAKGGTLCQSPAVEPLCTVCHEPAWDSAWHACELSGYPWGTDPAPEAGSHAVRCISPRLSPFLCIDNRKSGQVPGSQEWFDAGQILASGASESSLADLQSGYSCQLRALADCGSPDQRAYMQAGPQWQFRRCVVPSKHTQSAQLTLKLGPTLLPRPQQHVVHTAILTPPLLLWSQLPAVGVDKTHARTCRSNSGRVTYDGTTMQCMEYFCPTVTVSASALRRCIECGALDTLLTFPRASAVHAAPVTVLCDDPHTGNISLQCEVGGWKVRSGSCRRKTCPRDVVDLTGLFWGRMLDHVIAVPCKPTQPVSLASCMVE